MISQTQPQSTHELRHVARQGLLPARGAWLPGFGNMLVKELGEWFRTRRWLWQLLVWPTILNGVVAFILFILPIFETAGLETFENVPPEAQGLWWYLPLAVVGGTIGVIIQEKQSGTAAWILSKPVVRPAFILTKLAANTIGMLIFIILLPGLITLGETYLAAHQIVPVLPFLAAVGVTLLALFFYVSLVVLLGVLFESRGPVVGIAFLIMIGGRLIASFFPQIACFLPLSMDGIAQMVVLGLPLPVMAVSQLICTGVLSVVFILVALWRFQHKEL